MIRCLRLFPEVGDVPDWADYVGLKIKYLDGKKEMKIELEVELKENKWVIDDFDVRDRGELSPEKLDKAPAKSSKSSAEGKTTIDAGLTELLKNFLGALKSGDWNTVRHLCPDWEKKGDKELAEEVEKAQKEAGGKYFELASQVPSIGAIPAPALTLEFAMVGKFEWKETSVSVDIEFSSGAAVVDAVVVEHRASKDEPEEE